MSWQIFIFLNSWICVFVLFLNLDAAKLIILLYSMTCFDTKIIIFYTTLYSYWFFQFFTNDFLWTFFFQTKRKVETLRTASFDFHIFDFITCISYWFTVPPRHRGVKPKTSNTSRLRRSKDFVKPQIGLTFHPLYVTLVDSQFNARKYRIYRATQ